MPVASGSLLSPETQSPPESPSQAPRLGYEKFGESWGPRLSVRAPASRLSINYPSSVVPDLHPGKEGRAVPGCQHFRGCRQVCREVARGPL